MYMYACVYTYVCRRYVATTNIVEFRLSAKLLASQPRGLQARSQAPGASPSILTPCSLRRMVGLAFSGAYVPPQSSCVMCAYLVRGNSGCVSQSSLGHTVPTESGSQPNVCWWLPDVLTGWRLALSQVIFKMVGKRDVDVIGSQPS